MINRGGPKKIEYDPYPALGGTQFNRNLSLNTDALEWRLRVAQDIPKEEDPIKKIIQDNIQASCTVMVYGDNSFWTGSGFHIGNGVVVTAAHVAPQDIPTKINISFDGQNEFEAELIISDKNLDIALLHSSDIIGQIRPVALGDSDTLETGDIIATITSPEGWNDTATVGRVSNIHQGLGKYAPSPAWNDVFFIDADILQGSSGGMVIGTDGLVYGSVMGMAGQHADIGVGQRAICPSNKIKALIEHSKETQAASTTKRVVRSQVAPQLKPQIQALKPQMAQAAQSVYDQWEQGGEFDELNGGGICQDIAEAMASVINSNIIGGMAFTFGYEIGDQHVAVIVMSENETDEENELLENGEAFIVDIPPWVYETGSGYNWVKKQNISFDPGYISIDSLDYQEAKAWAE